MKSGRKWLRAHAYAAHVTAFVIMLAAPVMMYAAAEHAAAAQHASPAWIYPPLALFILANLLELFIP